jgi:O-antigen/teichoic acid export membrane protein
MDILVAGEGLQMIHAILGTVLTAVGEARKAAVVTIVSLIPSLAMLVFLIHIWGGTGAALSNLLITFMGCVILGVLVWRRFGTLMNKRSARNIALAGGLMILVFALLSDFELFSFLPCAGALAAYFVALITVREITRQDFVALVPWMRVQSYQITGR